MNKYLEKIASTRLVREIAKRCGEVPKVLIKPPAVIPFADNAPRAAGTVFKNQVGSNMRNQPTLDSLVSRGALRSPNKYAKGMRDGNEEMMGRIGQTISPAKNGILNELMKGLGGAVNFIDKGGKPRAVINTKVLNDTFKQRTGTYVSQKGPLRQAIIRHENIEGVETSKMPKVKNLDYQSMEPGRESHHIQRNFGEMNPQNKCM